MLPDEQQRERFAADLADLAIELADTSLPGELRERVFAVLAEVRRLRAQALSDQERKTAAFALKWLSGKELGRRREELRALAEKLGGK